MHILICEDNSMIIRAIEYKLLHEGYKTILAHNGEDAYEMMKDQEVDLVITDLILPKLSGMELLKNIRNELKSEVPIIVLSKIGSEDTVMEAFDNGADDYIVKPFSPNELAIRIKRLLNKRKK